jgi:Tho complex subunit 7
VRIQLLQSANEKERERYAREKLRINQTSEDVRAGNIHLRTTLSDAQAVLAQRKTYDALSEKITSNRLLRPREDQEEQLKRLETEIEDLERESQEYKVTWSDRRAQFGRIVEEGMNLRALIRDEKEEVERREGMADAEAEAEDGEVAASASNPGTPAHLSESGETAGEGGLTVNKTRPSSSREPSPLRVGSRAPSQTRTPLAAKAMAEDTAMVDDDEEEEGAIPEDGEEVEVAADAMDTT